MKRGRLEDRLRFAFLAFDLDHSGYIDRDEFLEMMRSINELKGNLYDNRSLKSMSGELFTLYDTNKDNKLSFAEFKIACKKEQLLLDTFWEIGFWNIIINFSQFLSQVLAVLCTQSESLPVLDFRDKVAHFPCQRNLHASSPVTSLPLILQALQLSYQSASHSLMGLASALLELAWSSLDCALCFPLKEENSVRYQAVCCSSEPDCKASVVLPSSL